MVMLELPLTFADFGKLAYENGILSSQPGFDLLCGDGVDNTTAVSTETGRFSFANSSTHC